MQNKFYEKLIILIILFVGVSIFTGAMIGTYVKRNKANTNNNNNNSLILSSISLSE